MMQHTTALPGAARAEREPGGRERRGAARCSWQGLLSLGLLASLGTSACSAALPGRGDASDVPPSNVSAATERLPQTWGGRLSLSERGGCLIEAGVVRCWSVAPELAGRTGPIRPRALELPAAATSVDGTLAFGCAVLETRAVHCWGDNRWGQLGAGSRVEGSDAPLRALQLDDATGVAVGEAHACATRAGGAVACWGNNSAGQCGHDLEHASAVRHLVVPTNVAGISDAEQVSVGTYASCALGAGGVSCWGAILQTAAGLARAPDRTRPTRLEPLSEARSLGLGDDCGCALLRDGRVGCFALGPAGCPSADPLVELAPLFEGHRMQRLVVGDAGACAAEERGGWRCWQHPFEPPAGGSARLAYVPLAPQAAPFALGDDVAYGHEPCAPGREALRCLAGSGSGSSSPALRERPFE